MLKSIVAVGTAFVLLSSAAMAQNRAVAKACAGDIKQMCAGIQPGEGRITACIKGHFNDLSAPCQGLMTHLVAIRKVCATDVKTLCAGTQPGGGRIEACVKAHINEVSEPCKDALAQASAGKS